MSNKLTAPQETTRESLQGKLRDTIIKEPAALRATLLLSIEQVICGKMSVPQANAVVGLSAEVHKSIRQEYDMAVYALENVGLVEPGNLLEVDYDDADK